MPALDNLPLLQARPVTSGPAEGRIAAISRFVWGEKYRLKQLDGTPIDLTIEDTWRRVATALAEPEKDSSLWAKRFYHALEDFQFIPAGRIVAGAGSERRVTLFNCYVMGDIGDDLGSIFAHLREAALTMQQGGGIGYDFSTIRPKGAPVRGVGADASGPLSFMDVWDSMCRTIMSAGSRRGAMMATLRCDHPDIEAFIEAKREPARLRCFNLSVLVTDAFMQAVRADADWDLKFGGTIYRTIKASDLWDGIMQATYDYAEPGVIFIDRINARNNISYCETIHSTNPCGEQPLPPYGACLLGSINLSRLVRDPFTERAVLDEDRLDELVATAVRMMDNTIDVSGFPLVEQRQEALAKRRIGLGVTGLADALIMCRVVYGSDEAVALASRWTSRISREAYLASANLAAEKGAFPLFDREPYLAGETIRELDADVRDAIATHGIRNALLTSIAPTGTISLLADNVSSGIEPVFAFAYTRRVKNADGSFREEEVSDHAVRRYRALFGEEAELPAYFVTAQTLTPRDHVRMQAAVQRHVDSAISKTVNCPEDISFEAFKSIYTDAYDSGCKGCTTYRPNAITGSVLEVKPPITAAPDVPAPIEHAAPLDREEKLSGATYKLKWVGSEHALYVTVNDIIHEGRRRPFEIFINSKNMDHYAWVVALTRMISAVFRRAGDVAFVVEELKAVFDPRGGQWQNGRYVPSLIAAIGGILERHMIETGFLPPGTDELPIPATAQHAGRPLGELCPKCGQPGLINQDGCLSCQHCTWSKCS
jgi:ribonucleoside-diphosphate reductase alpha chain